LDFLSIPIASSLPQEGFFDDGKGLNNPLPTNDFFLSEERYSPESLYFDKVLTHNLFSSTDSIE
jgi:hypothetical protein